MTDIAVALLRAVVAITLVLLLSMGLATIMSSVCLPKAKAAPAIDTSAECTLTVNLNAGAAAEGAEARLYRVASIDDGGNLTLTSSFSAYAAELSLSESQRASDAALLLEKVRNDGIAATASSTLGSTGSATFGRLAPGLYLLRMPSFERGGHTYSTTPTLIQLPELSGGSWRYSVSAQPKSEVDPEDPIDPGDPDEPVIPDPDEPVEPTPDDPINGGEDDDPNGSKPNRQDTDEGGGSDGGGGKLPQTGMLLWPVPVLLAGGLALVLTGLIRRNRSQR